MCFFSDSDYQGKSFCVGEGTADTTPEWNDVVSSVKVAAGYKVELAEDIGLGGRVLTLLADQPHLGGCFLNDLMSSYRVGPDTPSPFRSVNYLRGVSGCRLVAGQHNDEKGDSPHMYTDYIAQTTGQTPALWSGDFGFSNDENTRWAIVHEAAKQWSQGAIINMMFHACPPTLPAGQLCGWSDVNSPDKIPAGQTYLSAAQWADLVNEGGSLNVSWKAHLDTLSPYLQDLKDKGVEVLFRPLHEMNQAQFWWSKSGPDGTARLFQITHDHLVKTRGFTNLAFVWDMQDIWVDGVSPGANFADYYPGEDYFEVAALDVYDAGYTDTSYYRSLLSLSKGKPVAIGEAFSLPTASVQKALPQMSFFMIWAYGAMQLSNQDLSDIYGDPRVIRLADMPGW